MAIRSGTLLERSVNRLFMLAGFDPKNNKIIDGYEIDVYVEYKSFSLIIECKQYERSSLAIRNLIHQWESKNRLIGASKILFVLAGCDISKKDFELAKDFNISIWDETVLSDLTDLAIKSKDMAKKEILLKLNLKSEEISNEIKMIMEKYNVSENIAVSYIKKLIPLKYIEFSSKNKNVLTDKDFMRYIRNDICPNSSGTKMRKIFQIMLQKNYRTKEEALMREKNKLVEDELKKEKITKGGICFGVRIGTKQLQRMKQLMDIFNINLENALEFKDYKKSEINQLIKIKDKNPSFSLKQCQDYLNVRHEKTKNSVKKEMINTSTTTRESTAKTKDEVAIKKSKTFFNRVFNR